MKKGQFKFLFLGGLVLLLTGNPPLFAKQNLNLQGLDRLETRSDIRNKMSDEGKDRVRDERRDRLEDGNLNRDYRNGNNGKHKGQYKNGSKGKHKGQYKKGSKGKKKYKNKSKHKKGKGKK